MNSVVQQPVIADEQWSWDKKLGDLEPDCLDRGKYAKFLTGYLSGFIEQSYVMNLNAEWGAGKTYFLKRWQETIKDMYPTAYVDAWKHDFDDEPLLTVMAGIKEALEPYDTPSKEKWKQIVKSAGYLIKELTPSIIGGVVRSTIGVDLKGLQLENFADTAEQLTQKSFELMLNGHKKKTDEIENFKKLIESWLQEISKLKKDKKIYQCLSLSMSLIAADQPMQLRCWK